jgi:hypothetical protein
MLGQVREAALLFAQCPAPVAKVRRAIKSTEGALRTAKRRAQSSRVARSTTSSAVRSDIAKTDPDLGPMLRYRPRGAIVRQ